MDPMRKTPMGHEGATHLGQVSGNSLKLQSNEVEKEVLEIVMKKTRVEKMETFVPDD